MNEYIIAWLVYLLAVLSAQILLWRIFSFIANTELKLLLQLLLLALLITPAHLDIGEGFWAPAFMTALMEGINLGIEAALPRLLPVFSLMLLFTILALVRSFYRRRKVSV